MIPSRHAKITRTKRSKLRRWTVALCAANLIGTTALCGAEPDLVKLRVGRSIVLRTQADVYRTAVVDQSICDIAHFTPREISIIGRAAGQTQITFWFDDSHVEPITYLIDVR